jgi:hypothetical protein
MPASGRRARLGVCAKLANHERLVRVHAPLQTVDFFRRTAVPTHVFVARDDIEKLTEWVVDRDGCWIEVRCLQRGCYQPARIQPARCLFERGEELQPRRTLRRLVPNGPENDGSPILIASNHLRELLFGIAKRSRILPGDGPVNRYFRPDEQSHFIRQADHRFVVRVMR